MVGRYPRLLVIHPNLNRGGGSELVALEMIRSVLSAIACDVTLLTFVEPQWDQISNFYGVKLEVNGIKTVVAGLPRRFRSDWENFELIRQAFLNRAARRIADRFDLVISASGEIDVGVPAIQYVHFPVFASYYLRERNRMVGMNSIILRHQSADVAYRAILFRFGEITSQGIKKNRTLTNSNSTAEIINAVYGINSDVVYPLVLELHTPLENSFKPWNIQVRQIAYVGRFANDKNINDIVRVSEILIRSELVNQVVLIGRFASQKMQEEVERSCREQAEAIRILSNASNKIVRGVLSESRYHLNVRPYEPFGISIAESIALGCLIVGADSFNR